MGGFLWACARSNIQANNCQKWTHSPTQRTMMINYMFKFHLAGNKEERSRISKPDALHHCQNQMAKDYDHLHCNTLPDIYLRRLRAPTLPGQGRSCAEKQLLHTVRQRRLSAGAYDARGNGNSVCSGSGGKMGSFFIKKPNNRYLCTRVWDRGRGNAFGKRIWVNRDGRSSVLRTGLGKSRGWQGRFSCILWFIFRGSVR